MSVDEQKTAIPTLETAKSSSTALHLGQNAFALEWKNIGFEVEMGKGDSVKRKQILKNISGAAMPGELMAIMGPSGAGKSSLLDILAGRVRATSGEILVNQQKRSSDLRYTTTYVPQQDHLLPTLTVRETIHYAARLQLPQEVFTREQTLERVEEVIHDFGLERCSNTKIGNVVFRGVSGGEKRRVSIASQLVSDPQIIFLDEPTTGLDSEASYQVVAKLSALAKSNNKTIVMTVHQPSGKVYQMFDRICLLSAGEVVFCGKKGQALEFFSSVGSPVPAHYNPPDFFLRAINTDFMDNIEEGRGRIQNWVEQFSKYDSQRQEKLRIERADIEVDENRKKLGHSNGFITQAMILTERAFLNARRNAFLYWLRVIMFSKL
jgi:ABC-type multidrug transport system ATPase subunit